jgi:DNA-directed RNA polymerase specialized sigma24 family protein
MTIALFTSLEQEWARLVRSTDMASALRRWAASDEALRFANVAELEAVATAWDASGANDAVLSALLARASTDPRAARAVLQFVLPVLKAMVRRYSFAFDSAEDCTQEVVAAAIERICRYPWHRWPSWRTYVVRNLTRDIRHAVCRRVAPDAAVLTSSADVDWNVLEHCVAVPPTEPPGAARLRELVEAARECGQITAAQADAVLRRDVDGRSSTRRGAEQALRRTEDLRRLVEAALERGAITALHAEVVLRTRVEGATLAAVAATAGCSVQAVHGRRVRAERALGLDAA